MNFPLRLVTCFPTHDAVSMFSYPSHALVTYFPTHDLAYMFSFAWYWLHIFPHMTWLTCFLCLILVTYFPTHDCAYMFSCAWHWFHVFPDMTCLTLFPMLGTAWLQYNTMQYNNIQHNTSLLCNTLSFRCGVTWNDTPASLQVFHINQYRKSVCSRNN